ncbi:hypothetical protein EXIGLDRAFT_737175 [Exidia glandulosa HHB12029]|uniref:Uncharacterized protein n=1 Tax=Exidia glandulosa HHB12029 TaxID=1314781 RepID=A0A165J3J7_EXIGL|nr:hypothetical protein EXIGLDRAFT_737175 [Exidia glandulosa HHB12029]
MPYVLDPSFTGAHIEISPGSWSGPSFSTSVSIRRPTPGIGATLVTAKSRPSYWYRTQ